MFAGTPGFTTMKNVYRPTRLTGVKSASASYGSFFLRCGAAESGLLVARRSVYPSGAARAVCSAAIAPSAPGRFSTTIGWPSAVPSGCATMRATMSVEEPAPNGTMKRTGRDGYCAERDVLHSVSTSAASARRTVVISASSCPQSPR